MAEIGEARGKPDGGLYALGALEPHLEDSGSIWIAPGAVVLGNVHLASGVSVWFGAVIRADNEPMRIGEGANIQDSCVLHSDPGFPLTVGREATIGHRAILHGCTIGAGVLIGMGATVMNGAEVGENSVVGAGAVIPEGASIPPNSLVVGIPGRVVRELAEEQRMAGRAAAQHYRERIPQYSREFRKAVIPR